MPLPLGKLPPRLDSRTLQLADYLRPPRVELAGQGTTLSSEFALPPAPRSVDWTAKIPSWPMFSNDTLGDCTAAAAAHMIQCWTANAGDATFTPTDAQVIAAYSATGNYIPGDPATDNGAVELDVLNFWRQQGIAGHKIDSYVSFSAQNFDHTRAAINLFGGIYIGLALPLSAQNQDIWHTPSFFSRLLREGNLLRQKCAERFSGTRSFSSAIIRCYKGATFHPEHVCEGQSIQTRSHSHLINGLCQGTALAVPKSLQNSGVLTPEVYKLFSQGIYETRASVKNSRVLTPEAALINAQPIHQVRPGVSISDTAPGSWGGHAVPILAYDADTLTCITWGAKKRMTWEFFARYCDESYAPLSRDWLNAQGKDPQGLDIAALQTDLRALNETANAPRVTEVAN